MNDYVITNYNNHNIIIRNNDNDYCTGTPQWQSLSGGARIYHASSRNEGKLLRGDETQAEMATDVGEPAPEGAEGRVLAGSGSPRAGGAGAARRV